MSLNFKKYKFISSSIVAGGIPIALGIAMGIKKNKKKKQSSCIYRGHDF